jgi:hypothetical protein
MSRCPDQQDLPIFLYTTISMDLASSWKFWGGLAPDNSQATSQTDNPNE